MTATYTPPRVLSAGRYKAEWAWTGLSLPRSRSYYKAGFTPHEAYFWAIVNNCNTVAESIAMREDARLSMGELNYKAWEDEVVGSIVTSPDTVQ